MPRKPKLVTVCTDCKREDVGVVIDWSMNDKTPRYRTAKHSIKYQKKGGSPTCLGSRNLVPDALVFENV